MLDDGPLSDRALLLSRRAFGFGAAALPFVGKPVRPVVVASDEDVTTLDPHLIRNNHPIGSIIWSIFDSLVRRRPDGTHEPRLALGWEQPTADTWRFHLRPDVRFQNGEAFDAEAVVVSVNRMNISPFNGESQLWQQTNLRGVKALDPLTVAFTTDGPAVTMLYWLEEAFIAPPRYLAQASAAVIGEHPIGSGPYRFVEWQPGDHVTLTANDGHWAGPPPIRDVVFRAVPEQSSRLNELRAGSVDLVPGLDPDSAGSAASALSRTVQVPGLRKMHMGFSQAGIAALKDRRVRQAINHAVDVATMIDTLERGMATPLTSVVNPPNNDPSLRPFAYDPARATALLREAGHEGFAVEIAFDSKYSDALESCEVVAAYLGAIGLLSNVVAYESGHFAETLRARAFPGLYFYGFGALIEPLVELVIFTSDAVDNASGYTNPAFDRLVKTASVTTDQAARTTLLREAERMVWEDCPWLYLWHLPEINGLSNRLLYTPRADEYVEMYEARLAAS
jgi:peptide/nickel transport system substrate-binding protein